MSTAARSGPSLRSGQAAVRPATRLVGGKPRGISRTRQVPGDGLRQRLTQGGSPSWLTATTSTGCAPRCPSRLMAKRRWSTEPPVRGGVTWLKRSPFDCWVPPLTRPLRPAAGLSNGCPAVRAERSKLPDLCATGEQRVGTRGPVGQAADVLGRCAGSGASDRNGAGLASGAVCAVSRRVSQGTTCLGASPTATLTTGAESLSYLWSAS